eukprot:scaffold134_cov94-Amphora_coffeaeformis.AAC.20
MVRILGIYTVSTALNDVKNDTRLVPDLVLRIYSYPSLLQSKCRGMVTSEKTKRVFAFVELTPPSKSKSSFFAIRRIVMKPKEERYNNNTLKKVSASQLLGYSNELRKGDDL